MCDVAPFVLTADDAVPGTIALLEIAADWDVMPCTLTADDSVPGTTAVLGIIAEVLLANVEVVKPDTGPPKTERRISPTKPSTTSAAPLSML